MQADATRLTATEAAAAIRDGRLTSEGLTRALLERIAARDPAVAAWSFLDPERALTAARGLDRVSPRGPLHGVPVGVKDVILTADMPTQYNSPLYEGFAAAIDAPCVRLLRHAGALILGKTDTVEFAVDGRRARTRNPHDPARTPGGSSSGSAAAVADCQVPLSLGTQTGGSVIRPASYCGVFAMKPTWNAVNAEGFKVCSASIDTLGWYARCAEDLALAGEVLGLDPPSPERPLAGSRIALCRTPVWEAATDAAKEAFERTAARVAAAGAEVAAFDLPVEFEGLTAAHGTIMQSEMRASFLAEYREFGDRLYPALAATVRNETGLTRAALVDALDLAARCRARFDALAAPFDAVLTPSAPGEAPVGLNGTGTATFNRIWTLLHAPCINVPGLVGPEGLPIGITLTGPRFSDGRLLSLAGAVGRALEP